MAGMFDFMGGPQAQNLAPQDRQAIGQQSMLALASALLQAGGPSTRPTSFGQALGTAIPGMMQAQQQGAQQAMQRSIFDLQKRDLDRKDADASQNRTARERLFTALGNGGTDMGRPVDMKPLWAQAFPDQFASSEFDKLKPKPLVPIAEGGSLFDPNKNQVVAQGAPKDKRTSLMKEAEDAGLTQGTPEYRNFLLTGRRPVTNVNVNPAKADPLYDLDLDQFKGQLKAVNEGRALVPALTQVAEGLESGAPIGRSSEFTRPLRQFAQEMGWRDDPNLPAEEVVSSAMAYLIPRFRVEGSGTSSDRDMSMFQKAAPNYAKTPQGNIVIARSLLQMQSRRQAEMDEMRSYYRQNNNSLDGVGAHIDRKFGPLFPRPQSAEEHSRLPAGTVYLHPDRGYVVKR